MLGEIHVLRDYWVKLGVDLRKWSIQRTWFCKPQTLIYLRFFFPSGIGGNLPVTKQLWVDVFVLSAFFLSTTCCSIAAVSFRVLLWLGGLKSPGAAKKDSQSKKNTDVSSSPLGSSEEAAKIKPVWGLVWATLWSVCPLAVAHYHLLSTGWVDQSARIDQKQLDYIFLFCINLLYELCWI